MDEVLRPRRWYDWILNACMGGFLAIAEVYMWRTAYRPMHASQYVSFGFFAFLFGSVWYWFATVTLGHRRGRLPLPPNPMPKLSERWRSAGTILHVSKILDQGEDFGYDDIMKTLTNKGYKVDSLAIGERGWTERGALPWEIPDGPSELECAANEIKGDKDVEEE